MVVCGLDTNIGFLKMMLAVTLLLLCLSACETIVDVDVEPHEPRLVIYCYAQSGNFGHELTASHSAGFLGNDAPDSVRDAQILVKRDGEPIGDFFYLNNPEKPSEYLGDFFLSETVGSEYRLEASSPDYPEVYAVQQMPEKGRLVNMEYLGEAIGSELDEEEFYEYEITIKDEDAGAENYYSIQFFEYDSAFSDYDRIDIFSDNPLLAPGLRRELLLDDITFNGGEIRIRIQSELSLEYFDEFEHRVLAIRLISMTRDRFLYGVSYRRYRDSEDNPFAEPVTIHSNIQGGYGLFSVEQMVEYVY
jgi:hypothetical protein